MTSTLITGGIGLLAALVGAFGGYLTARHRSRADAEMAEHRAQEERERQLRELALQMASLEAARNPDSGHSLIAYWTVMQHLLAESDVRLGDLDDSLKPMADAVNERFQAACQPLHPDWPALRNRLAGMAEGSADSRSSDTPQLWTP